MEGEKPIFSSEPKLSLVASATLEARLDEIGVPFTITVESNGTFTIKVDEDIGNDVSAIIDELKTENKYSNGLAHPWLENILLSGDQNHRVIYYNQPD